MGEVTHKTEVGGGRGGKERVWTDLKISGLSDRFPDVHVHTYIYVACTNT